ncbi:hypothetical protein GCK72_008820 [Caenorhabditis remanei]|uniref:Uncharacterized protein n=1 Tax=Caenorhabditis remanei TaxID=31234 RepID=A0A6A5H0M9_CAERE|nr:hypothetical protein GCK72_008820 [Caenorhabditis remanei]KAF1760571.1 hypothetical protein GCK72_008820 [Caenorhabditis remanei]
MFSSKFLVLIVIAFLAVGVVEGLEARNWPMSSQPSAEPSEGPGAINKAGHRGRRVHREAVESRICILPYVCIPI